mmetsp:Transcript_46653/g.141351  ORF Transcript_46653/g.141351 Transcript_46653/m.141351 type:complete len:551 (-) Transcript_46653:129-1781(-)
MRFYLPLLCLAVAPTPGISFSSVGARICPSSAVHHCTGKCSLSAHQMKGYGESRPLSCRRSAYCRSRPSRPSQSVWQESIFTARKASITVRSLPMDSSSDRDASLPAASSKESLGEEASAATQSLSQATFNLIKACIGSGVLALPAGVAAMGDVPMALVPASGMLAFLGILSAYSFFMLGRLAKNGGNGASPTSFGEAWEKEVGPKSSWLVVLSCLLTPYGAALAYSIMLGDIVSSMAHSAGLKGILAMRHTSILAVSLGVLYPLCNLKSLAALAPLSMVGVAGICMTCAFMALRYFSGAYLPGGAFHGAIAPTLQPSFGTIGVSKVFTPSALILGGMAATAYLVHFSAYDFYSDLEDNSLKRFGLLSLLGFGGTCAISIVMMSLGFLTFGGNSAGLILNNYSTQDIGATMCRVVMAISLVGSYPIFFRGIKSAFIDLFYKNKDITDHFSSTLTNILLASLTGLSLVLKNAGFMVSFVGAVMGSAIIYIFPPIMYLKSSSRRIKQGSMRKSKRVILEQAVCKLLICLGALMGVIGGTVTVMDAFFPHLLQ